MDKLRNWVRGFFGFSRAETNGFLILIPLMTVALFSEPVYRYWTSKMPWDSTEDVRILDSLISQLKWATPDTVIVPKKNHTASFHSFNPNQVTAQELISMGLSEGIARRLVRFREKGGSFRKKEDVIKIFGMDSTWYQQALPWMTLPEVKNTIAYTSRPNSKEFTLERIDLNLADSLQLLSVYGIGPALSKRIRTFRNRLGGFVNLNQLQEVYGLDSSVLRNLQKKFYIQETFKPKQLSLNSVTREELTNHPYIRWKEAQAILSYRLQHGAFQSLDQLNEVGVLTPEWIARIRPYLLLENNN
jgi:DNA uptake protein ComE-like DNA-binding protein